MTELGKHPSHLAATWLITAVPVPGWDGLPGEEGCRANAKGPVGFIGGHLAPGDLWSERTSPAAPLVQNIIPPFAGPHGALFSQYPGTSSK